MPNLDDYHAFESTSGGSGGGNGDGIGCLAWVVIGITAFLLIYSIANDASWDAIDSLLGIGLIAFLIANSLFR